MKQNSHAAIHATFEASNAGSIHFGEVIYPEFKVLTQKAGCIGYTVWIAGRHVTYFGRKGETHMERFPS